jgi:hypothetical protein
VVPDKTSGGFPIYTQTVKTESSRFVDIVYLSVVPHSRTSLGLLPTMSLGNPPPQLGDENDTEVTPPFPHDSMVTVRLSGPPEVIVKTEEANSEDRHSEEVATVPSPRTSTIAPHPEESPDSSKTLTIQTSNLEDVPIADATPDSIVDEEAQTEDSEIRRGSESSVSSGEGQVNWEELEKTEEMEPRDQDSEDVSLVLAVTISFSC